MSKNSLHLKFGITILISIQSFLKNCLNYIFIILYLLYLYFSFKVIFVSSLFKLLNRFNLAFFSVYLMPLIIRLWWILLKFCVNLDIFYNFS